MCNQKDIANKFSGYFISVVKKLLENMGEINKFQDYLYDLNKCNMFLKEKDPGVVNYLNVSFIKIFFKDEKNRDIQTSCWN